MNLNQSETKFTNRLNPAESGVGMIRINFYWQFGLDQSELELVRIENWVSDWLGFIRIVASDYVGSIFYLFHQTSYKKFFGSVWIQISEWIKIVLIGSDWNPIRYFRQGSLGTPMKHTSKLAHTFNSTHSHLRFLWC